MGRMTILLFSVVAYAIFFATFLYLIAFVGDIAGVPRTVDSGPSADVGVAAAIDLALIALFGLQHSVMARPGFKAAWTRIVPPAAERSVYVLLTSAVLILLFWQWRPIDLIVWRIEHPLAAALMWGLFALGFGLVLVSTFLLSHFELFGLKQAWFNLRGATPPSAPLSQPLFYKLVRHPLYVGFLIAFWATPEMTGGHLLFALGMTAYILVAIRYEERDLVAHFGESYVDYRRRVGMLVPRLRRGG
jgi:protein-S-isoprenylcysteine O-methyltransferase Ste14